MSWLNFPRLLTLAAIVLTSALTMDRVWSQAPIISADEVEGDESPFEDDVVDNSTLVDAVDYTCGCDDLSCLGDCGGDGSRTWVTAD